MAKMKLSRALKHSAPKKPKECFDIDDPVLVWRKKLISNLIGEWIRPYNVKSSSKTEINLNNREHKPIHYNPNQKVPPTGQMCR